MNVTRKLPFVMFASALLCLTLVGAVHVNSALAQAGVQQDDLPPPGQHPKPPVAGGITQRQMVFMGPTTVSAAGSFVYVIRNNTLYQFRATDLQMVQQRALPTP